MNEVIIILGAGMIYGVVIFGYGYYLGYNKGYKDAADYYEDLSL